MLSAAGVRGPQTWAELTAAAQRLASSMPSRRQADLPGPDWARMLAFVYQNGGSFLNATKTKRPSRRRSRQAVNFYVGLIKSGLAGTPAQLGVGWCGEALGKEKAAIVFEGNWVVPFMAEQLPERRSSRVNKMVRGQAGRQPRVHGLVLDGQGLEEQAGRLDS